MNSALADAAFAAFMIFCRIGSCLMLVPGYSSPRIPMQFRLLLAIAVSLSLTPLLFDMTATALAPVAPRLRPFLLVNEVVSGGSIGLMARVELLALQFAATFVANAIGLAGIPGQPIDDTEALPPLTSLLSMAAVMVLLASGLHVEILKALVQSYAAMPVRLGIDAGWLLDNLTRVVASSWMMALRLSGPFIVYSVIVNIAVGLASKFTPQVSLYFASLGLVTMGGLFILFLVTPEWLGVFLDSYESWLSGRMG